MSTQLIRKFIFTVIILLAGCNDLQQELGLEYIPPVIVDEINFIENFQKRYSVSFDKETIFKMEFIGYLTEGGGSNPKGGQQLSGFFKLVGGAESIILKGEYAYTFNANSVGGVLFEIDTKNLDISKDYTLIFQLNPASPEVLKMYDPKIKIYLKRGGSNPLTF